LRHFFDFDNIDADYGGHPLDPDDSTHSKILSIYLPLDATDRQIKDYFLKMDSRMSRWDQLVKESKRHRKAKQYYRDCYFGLIPPDRIHVKKEHWLKILEEKEELQAKLDEYESMEVYQTYAKQKEILKRMGETLELLVYPYLIEPNTVQNIIAMATGKKFKDVNMNDYTGNVLQMARELKRGEIPK